MKATKRCGYVAYGSIRASDMHTSSLSLETRNYILLSGERNSPNRKSGLFKHARRSIAHPEITVPGKLVAPNSCAIFAIRKTSFVPHIHRHYSPGGRTPRIQPHLFRGENPRSIGVAYFEWKLSGRESTQIKRNRA